MLENTLKKLAIFFGIVLLLGSVFLSYDGFDQSVSGSNTEYTLLAMVIGYSLAITFNLLEFIVSSKTENLNTTLKVLGLLAYAYSIYTNYLGAQGLLHMDTGMAVIVALFMDIVPEPMIAWGLGEAIMHDLFKNLGGFVAAPIGKSSNGGGQQNHGGGGQQQQNHNNSNQREPQYHSPMSDQYHPSPDFMNAPQGREARQNFNGGNNGNRGQNNGKKPQQMPQNGHGHSQGNRRG